MSHLLYETATRGATLACGGMVLLVTWGVPQATAGELALFTALAMGAIARAVLR